MKRFLVLLFIFANCTICFSQTKAEMKREINDLKLMIEAYKQTIKEKDVQLQSLRDEYVNLQALMAKIGGILSIDSVDVAQTSNVPAEKKRR